MMQQARGAVRAPMLEGLPRQCWVFCILHCFMAIGNLFRTFLEARVPADYVAKVKVMLCIANVGSTFRRSVTVDGEQTATLFATWRVITEICGMVATEEDETICAMDCLFRVFYHIRQKKNHFPERCCTIGRRVFKCLAPSSCLSYLYMIENTFAALVMILEIFDFECHFPRDLLSDFEIQMRIRQRRST